MRQVRNQNTGCFDRLRNNHTKNTTHINNRRVGFEILDPSSAKRMSLSSIPRTSKGRIGKEDNMEQWP